jgi:serine/threonine protein phosphatase PrpC
MVPEEAVARELAAPGKAARVCRRLVDLALEAGGKDNVTVVLGRYRIPEAPRG